jgi:hypothetical protein
MVFGRLFAPRMHFYDNIHDHEQYERMRRRVLAEMALVKKHMQQARNKETIHQLRIQYSRLEMALMHVKQQELQNKMQHHESATAQYQHDPVMKKFHAHHRAAARKTRADLYELQRHIAKKQRY